MELIILNLSLSTGEVLSAGASYEVRNKPQKGRGSTYCMESIRVVARHAKARVSLARKLQLKETRLLYYCNYSVLIMSSAERLSRRLNAWVKEGRDMLGGADGAAIAEMVAEFMDSDDPEDQPPECEH